MNGFSKTRVVITGIGICAPNGISIPEFHDALKNQTSGIRFDKDMERLGFSCTVSAKPQIPQEHIGNYLSELEQRNFNASGILYGLIAGMDAWKDAGLIANSDSPDYDSGTIFGSGTLGVEKFRESIYKIDEGQTRRLGSTNVLQTMTSGISAFLGGKLGLGNMVTTNSSACTTGTEALLMAYDRIQLGKAKRILAGSTSDSGPYIWAGFDALKVCNYKSNEHPEKASRPMSASAAGFIPGSGAGAYVVESLESALERGAKIYAEILGGHSNSGGQRGLGSMTAPNPEAVKKCIIRAYQQAGIQPEDIDVINGHLTATSKDPLEIQNWVEALGRSGANFPFINSLKSLIGHGLSASGSMELVACILQLHHQFLFGNTNIEDLHPEISDLIAFYRIPTASNNLKFNILAKASFGFGDVNACVILKKYS